MCVNAQTATDNKVEPSKLTVSATEPKSGPAVTQALVEQALVRAIHGRNPEQSLAEFMGLGSDGLRHALDELQRLLNMAKEAQAGLRAQQDAKVNLVDETGFQTPDLNAVRDAVQGLYPESALAESGPLVIVVTTGTLELLRRFGSDG